jgi:hypothetical protein
MSFADPAHLAEGYGAQRDGIPRQANPYARWTTAWTTWSAGWRRAALDAEARDQIETPCMDTDPEHIRAMSPIFFEGPLSLD